MSNALELFADGVRSVWGPLTTELVLACRQELEHLVRAPAAELWLAGLYRDMPARAELHIDPAGALPCWPMPNLPGSTVRRMTMAGDG